MGGYLTISSLSLPLSLSLSLPPPPPPPPFLSIYIKATWMTDEAHIFSGGKEGSSQQGNYLEKK